MAKKIPESRMCQIFLDEHAQVSEGHAALKYLFNVNFESLCPGSVVIANLQHPAKVVR